MILSPKYKFSFFTGFLILSLISLKAQEKIKILENKKIQFERVISLYSDSIKIIDSEILKLKSQQIKKIVADSSLTSLVIKGAKLKSSPSFSGKEIEILKEDEKVIILDYSNGYFGVCTQTVCGYMSEVWLKRNDKINEFIAVKKKEFNDLEELKIERTKKQNQKEYLLLENKYIAKYGKTTYNKLKQGYYWVGMTKEMAMISLGEPNSVNRSVGSWGVHEQWVYSSIYIYFENGNLTSYQD